MTSFPSEKVKPPRIKECGVHVECKVTWTKPIGSTCLVLGDVVSMSAHREIEKSKVKNKIGKLNPPLYFSFKEDEGARIWMFAEIGRIDTITEKDEKSKSQAKTFVQCS